MPTAEQIPGRLDIVIHNGDAFSLELDFDTSIAGMNWDAKVDHTQGQTAFALGSTDPSMTLTLASSDTTLIPVGTHDWYLDRTDAGSERRWLAGRFTVIRYYP